MLLSDWTFSFAAIAGSQKLTVYNNFIGWDRVPAIVQLEKRLTESGYTPIRDIISVSRCEADEKITYEVRQRIAFNKGFGQLIFIICGTGDTLEQAISNAQTRVFALFYQGEPIEGGKGQLKKCQEIARQLLAEHGQHLASDSYIIVPYRTRAGRGGWQDKVAQRQFRVSELKENQG